ncbi:protein pal1 [Diplogelasinospora grovesii]|uniref:Protein pal1 n=1 Tax=Diplogelasinospora grovesii TaxID=303347 RepID=A0AAN6NDF5_9PEZI|nr:protein pal1 [Diplogelasinospora grovesii]
MFGRDSEDDVVDKQWASNYILGPLYDPEPSQVCATRFKPLPTPPASGSPSRRSRASGTEEDDENRPFLSRVLSRSNSVKDKPLPPSPPRTRYPPISNLERKRSLHTSKPPQTRWNQGTVLVRANSVASSRPSADERTSTVGDKAKGLHRTNSLAERFPGDKSHRPLAMLTQEHYAKERGDSPPRRSASLRQRFPGDMSHRPLDMIKREHRAADRAPHLHNHRRQQPSDTIDSLDHTGLYHHEGPFDATMKSRNTNKKYAPVEAVKETNMEALKATPVEFLKDSLTKHVPLQGTAVVPPGMRDMGGRKMEYEEGADLMRERDAAGGAYKRWPDIPYKDDDLKGKGEPSYTFERARKEEKARLREQRGGVSLTDAPVNYEMQPMLSRNNGDRKEDSGARVRQRSVSNAAEGSSSRYQPNGYSNDVSNSSNLHRSNTTGKSFTQSLKRRFGSIRRKKTPEQLH